MQVISKDVCFYICLYLKIKDLLSMMMVCKKFNIFLKGNCYFWEVYYEKHFSEKMIVGNKKYFEAIKKLYNKDSGWNCDKILNGIKNELKVNILEDDCYVITSITRGIKKAFSKLTFECGRECALFRGVVNYGFIGHLDIGICSHDCDYDKWGTVDNKM